MSGFEFRVSVFGFRVQGLGIEIKGLGIEIWGLIDGLPALGPGRGGAMAGGMRPPARGYRGYSKLRTHTAVRPYGRASPRSIGPPWGLCASLITSNTCTVYRGTSIIKDTQPHRITIGP